MNKHFIAASFFFILMVTAFGQSGPGFRAGKNEMIPYSNLSHPLVEPHLAINPRNGDHMVVTAIVFDSAAPTAAGDHIVVFATRDNGKTWKQTDFPMTHGGDPWVAIRNDKDVVLVALAGYEDSPRTSLVYYTSSDGGFTWNKEPIKLGGGHDHPTMISDPNSGRLYLLSSLLKRNPSGERISYAYLNYSDDWKKFRDTGALFSIGKNNSNTLTAGVHSAGSVILPYIEHPFENHASETGARTGNSSIKYAYSKEGAHFIGPVLLTDNIGIAKGFAVMAIDQHSKYKGRMYFVKNTGTDPARSHGLFLKYADDLNGPWSADIRIDHNNQTEKFIRTSAIAINKEGVIGIAWIDRRNDPQLKKNDVYFTVSHDGGKTFENEMRVTDVSADPLVPGNGKTGERFMSGGDYMGLATKPDGSFQLAWADSRSGVFQLYTSTITPAQQKDSNQLAAKLDKILSEQFKANATGATVLVASKGKVIYQKAFGMANMELNVPMQVDNVFRIGSITKQFTAIAILQLAEQGKLNLQDEITKYIPDYPTQGNKITIEHLLTHTSGIRNHSTIRDTVQRGKLDLTTSEMINLFKSQPIRFTPGSKYEYSNSGYFLLGYIIEKITGKTYAQYLDEHFFNPIGMTSSLYANDIKLVKNRAAGYVIRNKVLENSSYISQTQPYAAGSIQSTVTDLFKWQQALLGYKLVKKETLDKAWSRYILNDGTKSNYGYGWRQGYIQGSPSLWHGGLINGFITMAMYLPKEDVFVTVLTNCECNSPEDITARIAALAIGQPYEYEAIAIDNVIAQGYAGVYENESGLQKVITIQGNQVYFQTGRSPKSNIKAYQKDKFFFENDPMLTLEFIRNNKGKVEKLITKSRIAVETWNKTNKPIPSEDGIKLDEKILAAYVGIYEVTPEFSITITKEKDRLIVEPTGQEKFEIFADSENKFFLKINDAQLEFVKDSSGKVTKVIITQGGRRTEAKKIK